MAQAAGAAYAAHDPERVQTEDDAGPERPPSDAELAYLDARVDETGAAVKKIKAQIKGLERSLKSAEQLHADAKEAKRAGRDLPEVQRRRAA